MLLTIYKKYVIISSARMETYIAKRAMTNEQHLKEVLFFCVQKSVKKIKKQAKQNYFNKNFQKRRMKKWKKKRTFQAMKKQEN